MSIDAIVGSVNVRSNEVEINLVPRINERGFPTLPGQDTLWLIGGSPVLPQKGDVMWGGSGSVMLVRNHKEIAEFKRIGYTRIEYMKPHFHAEYEEPEG